MAPCRPGCTTPSVNIRRCSCRHFAQSDGGLWAAQANVLVANHQAPRRAHEFGHRPRRVWQQRQMVGQVGHAGGIGQGQHLAEERERHRTYARSYICPDPGTLSARLAMALWICTISVFYFCPAVPRSSPFHPLSSAAWLDQGPTPGAATTCKQRDMSKTTSTEPPT